MHQQPTGVALAEPAGPEHLAAEVRYLISVAIERQQKAGGIDAVAYGLLRHAQDGLAQLATEATR